MNTGSPSRNRATCKALATWAASLKSKTRKAANKSPDKVQPKDVTPAAESRTQVAVNSEGKTNEATKQGKEPLKQGQDKPTVKQKEKQDKTQDKSLKADKPKKSKGMKL